MVVVLLLIICSVILYSKTKQVYRLRKENELLKQQLNDCRYLNYGIGSPNNQQL